MTIGTRYRNDATGNDAATAYPYQFKIFAATDLRVIVRDTATGIETVLTYPTHYTVSNVGNKNGGNVTLASVSGAWQNANGTLKTGYAIAIRRTVSVEQDTDIRNQGSFHADTHEDEFDYLTMIDQQQEDKLARALLLGESYDPTAFDLTLPAPSAGLVLAWNATEDGLVNVASPGALTVSGYIATLLDDLNAAAARTTLGLSSPMSTGSIIDAKGDLIAGTANDTPARVAVGADGLVLRAKSTATPGLEWAAPAVGVSNGWGFTGAWVSATTVNFVAGEIVLKDSNGGTILLATVNENADITVSGAGGLDTGAEAVSTWYYIWLIAKLDGTKKLMLSASATAPTLPAGYTFMARVGTVRNDVAGNFTNYRQVGRHIFTVAQVNVHASAGGTTLAETTISLTGVVPPIAHSIYGDMSGYMSQVSGSPLTMYLILRVVTGQDYQRLDAAQSSGNYMSVGGGFVAPNLSQTLYILHLCNNGATVPADRLTRVDVYGYSIPMGGV